MLKAINKENRQELKDYLQSRSSGISAEILLKTNDIIEDVRTNQDQAVKKYTRNFDGVDLQDLQVSRQEIEEAAAKADPAFRKALEQAASNIRDFHVLQKQDGYRLEKEMGIYLGQRVIPLDSVGIYVPGGRAQYPSSVLMNAIPAKVAGVKRIVMVTPPSKEGTLHPNIAAAALCAGVDEIYKVGGAQAVAALAYGTESIAPVDKIIGPGNIFVAAAKKLVFGQVDIDMIAGPSEILVIADEKADPACTAADLLSQAEHDPMASAVLLSNSQKLIDQVNEQLRLQTDQLPKKSIVEESLKNYGTSILCDTLEECVEISNAVAPEHLELQTEQFEQLLPLVKHAGSVFLGYSTCESVGDYFGGTNHVLPTSGTARFSSALSVDAFVKKSSYLYYSDQAIQAYGAQIVKMAEEEDLQAHANAVKVRMK